VTVARQGFRVEIKPFLVISPFELSVCSGEQHAPPCHSVQPRAFAERLPGGFVTGPTTVVHSDPDILGGTPVFVGTRVPLQNLIDCLGGGYSLDEFLRQFPSVRREQAQAALDLAREALEAKLVVA
jgi:uncharacterized protein (DUF433 family)